MPGYQYDIQNIVGHYNLANWLLSVRLGSVPVSSIEKSTLGQSVLQIFYELRRLAQYSYYLWKHNYTLPVDMLTYNVHNI